MQRAAGRHWFDRIDETVILGALPLRSVTDEVMFVCSVVLCGQGSGLLWTPVLIPLYRSNAPSQGEEGNW